MKLLDGQISKKTTANINAKVEGEDEDSVSSYSNRQIY
jgi:hypothetical protein